MSETPLMDVLADQMGTEGGSCRHCKQRPATVQWVGEGGALALYHGAYAWWCEICATEAQLAYAKERARSVRELERKLASLRNAAPERRRYLPPEPTQPSEVTDQEEGPFRRVINDLTGGCGCACHTGLGYNSSCVHCSPEPTQPSKEGKT